KLTPIRTTEKTRLGMLGENFLIWESGRVREGFTAIAHTQAHMHAHAHTRTCVMLGKTLPNRPIRFDAQIGSKTYAFSAGEEEPSQTLPAALWLLKLFQQLTLRSWESWKNRALPTRPARGSVGRVSWVSDYSKLSSSKSSSESSKDKRCCRISCKV